MIVVDTNIITYLYLPTEYTALAERLLEQDPDWIAPSLWRSELRNVLAHYLRKRLLTFDKAFAAKRRRCLRSASTTPIPARCYASSKGAIVRRTTANSSRWRRNSAPPRDDGQEGPERLPGPRDFSVGGIVLSGVVSENAQNKARQANGI